MPSGRTASLIAALVSAVTLLAVGAGVVSAAKDDTRLASLPTGDDGSGNNDNSFIASISADGRFVAFTSNADNLAANDADGLFDVFVRDLVTGTTTLASLPTGSDGSGNNNHSGGASISADGRFVAFGSASDNLAANDNDSLTNLYVRDLVTGTTTLASLPTGDDGSGNDATASDASISGDGRFVAFASGSDNLAANDNNAFGNVYVRDLVTSTTTLASLPTGDDGSGNNNNSGLPSISADGRFVAFESHSDNLAANDNDGVLNVYVRDLVAGTTTLASLPTGSDGSGNNSVSSGASISADGRFVAFQSSSDNLAANDNDGVTNVYVRDLLTETTRLASLPTGSDGSVNTAGSSDASISADGRFVAFQSSSTTLATNDNNALTNIFVRDLVAGTTTLASLPTGSDGSGNDAVSLSAEISGDGRYVSFHSTSDNLAANDNDAVTNVYVRTLLLDPPRNVSRPRLTGQAVVGQTLGCADGVWTEGALTRVWRRNEVPITGATGTTYALDSADAGEVVDCLVTASNADGSDSAASNAVLPIEPVQGPAGADGATGTGGSSGPTGPPGPAGPAGTPAIKLLVGLISDRVGARIGRPVRFRYLATVAGTAKLAILRGRRVVARARGRASAGRNVLRWNGKGKRPLAAGRYRTRLTLRSSDGQVDGDRGRLTLRRR